MINNGIPSLISQLDKQFLGTPMSKSERELARLCWLGGAWALFTSIAEGMKNGNAAEVQKAYAEELMQFVNEVRSANNT